MDFTQFRETGELSDITVTVNGKAFQLHKFPLFIKSDFFKSLAGTTGKEAEHVELDEFPGGAETFQMVADFCYNIDIEIKKDNVAELRCAAEFLKMNGAGNLKDTTDR